MPLCPMGPHGPPRGGRPNSAPPVAVHRPTNQCLSSNVTHTTIFAVDGIRGSPENGRLSMPLRTIGRIELSETRPISKACQRVMRVIDSNVSARSTGSEREHRILAASRSAKRALLHREREGRVNTSTVNISRLGDSVTYTVIL